MGARSDRFNELIAQLGLTPREASEFLDVADRTSRRWASNEPGFEVPLAVIMLFELMVRLRLMPEHVRMLTEAGGNAYDEAANAVEAQGLFEVMRPLIANRPPQVQGALLADLLALFLTGHHPALREEILGLHIDAVRQLIEPNEKIMFPEGKPEGWEKQ